MQPAGMLDTPECRQVLGGENQPPQHRIMADSTIGSVVTFACRGRLLQGDQMAPCAVYDKAEVSFKRT